MQVVLKPFRDTNDEGPHSTAVIGQHCRFDAGLVLALRGGKALEAGSVKQSCDAGHSRASFCNGQLLIFARRNDRGAWVRSEFKARKINTEGDRSEGCERCRPIVTEAPCRLARREPTAAAATATQSRMSACQIVSGSQFAHRRRTWTRPGIGRIMPEWLRASRWPPRPLH